MSENTTHYVSQNLLIINDNNDISTALLEHLRGKYTVFTSGTLEDALGILEKEDIQVIIGHQGVSDINGISFFQFINTQYPHLILLTLADNTNLNAALSAISNGLVYRYIALPWHPLELDSILNQAIEKYDLLKSNRQLVKNLTNLTIDLETHIQQRTKEIAEKVATIEKSEQRLVEAQRLASIGNWELNLETNQLYWSNEIFRIFEIDPTQFSATYPSFLDTIHPDDREAVNHAYQQSLKNKLPYEISHRLLMPDGSIKHVKECCITKYNNNGEPTLSVGTVQDITKLKNAEEELKRRESYLTAILENLPGLVWLKDAESRLLLTNTKYNTATGNSEPGALVGKSDFDIWPKQLAEKYVADDKKVIESKKQLHIEEQIVDNDTVKWFETFKMPLLDDEGKLIGTTGYSYDISTRKLAELQLRDSEEKFKKAFTTSPDCINITSLENGLFVSINNGFTRITGYTEADVLGKDLATIDIWNDIAERDNFIRCLKEKGIVENFISKFKTKQGEIVYGMVSASIIELYGSKHIMSITRDITERQKAEESIRKSKERLNRAEFASKSGNWEYLVESGKLKASKGAGKIYGLSNKNITLENAKKLRLLEYDGLMDAALKNLIERNAPYDIEYKIRSADTGELKDIYSSAVYDAERKVVFGVIQDITDRKKAENALQESEYRLKVIFENAPDAMFLADPISGKIVDANIAACELFKKQKNELIGLYQYELHPTENNDMSRNTFKSHFDSNEISGKNNPVENSVLRSDGTQIPVEILGKSVQIGGKLFLLGTFRDISERKKLTLEINESEAQIKKTLIESSELIMSDINSIDYQKIADTVLRISGAKYLAFNMNDINNTQFTTVALSGASDHLSKLKSILGFNLQNKKWDLDPIKDQKTEGSIVSHFGSLLDIIGDIFPKVIAKIVENVFNLGEVVIVRITKEKNTLGNFTLFYEKAKTIRNTELVGLYANQVGLFVERKRAEDALNQKMSELVKYQQLTVGRELAMIDLKKEINDLLMKAGKEPKYKIVG